MATLNDLVAAEADCKRLEAEIERLRRERDEIKSEAADMAVALRRAMADAATFQARAERLRAALGQACRQWRMYADAQEDRGDF